MENIMLFSFAAMSVFMIVTILSISEFSCQQNQRLAAVCKSAKPLIIRGTIISRR